MKKRDPKKQKGGFRRKDQQAPAAPEIENQGMRLNKFVAHSGICSRRQAAELVKAGKIKVNGNVVLEPFYLVQKEDKVEYEGKQLLLEEKKVYLLLNKPKDYITTLSDDRGRKTVMDLIDPNIKERIYPVGRLDRATTGLLLLTNDGELAQKLAHPSHEIKKFYHVRLDKPVSQQDIDKIAAGLQLEDGPAPVNGVDYIRAKEKNEVGIEIHIGRNRIVRRIFEHLGYTVIRLDRTYYAGLTKKDLPRGRFRRLTDREVIMLRHFL
jgi:23S rRNA pseudouridine2605 synthase